MIVKIDEREKSSRIHSAIKFFEKMGYSTSVETLPVGDYVFGDKICFEYKSALLRVVGRKGRTKRRKSSDPVCLISGLMS